MGRDVDGGIGRGFGLTPQACTPAIGSPSDRLGNSSGSRSSALAACVDNVVSTHSP